jgi:hypothetical protein
MKREAMVRQLAPVAPACFSSRDQWQEYLSAAVAEQRLEHEPGPLVFTRRGVVALDTDAGLATVPPTLNVAVLIFKGRHVSFNFEVDFCAECTVAYRVQMQRAKRCNPNHLRELLEPAL